jgi:hypothetical protein
MHIHSLVAQERHFDGHRAAERGDRHELASEEDAVHHVAVKVIVYC